MKNYIPLSLSLISALFFIFTSCEEDPSPATLSTFSATEITANSAKSGGDITDDGGTLVTRRGIIWSSSENPDLDDNEGMTEDGKGKGKFTSELKNLSPNTTYYVRAYSVNSAGTAYGNQVSFTTGVEPGADFAADETVIETGVTVNFSDESTGDPSGWEWEFGDGNTSTEQNPSHAYESAGTYDVKLTVSNEYGEDSKIKQDYISAGSKPTAMFGVSEREVETGITVNFSDESTGDPSGWEWEFGDGNTSTEQNPSHAYESAGTYDVKLTVSNQFGSDSDTKTGLISVEEKITVKWKFEATDPLFTSPSIASDGTVYIGSRGNNLYAVNTGGTEKWRFEASESIMSSPTIGPDGTIYAGSHDGHLYALETDGTEKWRFETGDWVLRSPAIDSEGTIYAGSLDGYLYAISPEGEEEWKFDAKYPIRSSPAIGEDGTIYFGVYGIYSYQLYALNSDGTKKWGFEANDRISACPAIDADGTVYIGSIDNNIYAVNPDGTLKWEYETDGYVHSSATIGSDGTIYIGSNDNNLYALKPDGELKWKFAAGRNISSAAAIDSEGTIYFGSDDNNIYAVNPDGTEKWRIETEGNISSAPAIGPDGTIYIGSGDGFLYAIYGGQIQLADTPWPKFHNNLKNTGRKED